MQIVRDSGKLTRVYSVEVVCPWCKASNLRFDLEFNVIYFEDGQTTESKKAVKNVCAHCFTICGELPRMDFLCARCGQLAIHAEADPSSEWALFNKVFAEGYQFEGFYRHLLVEGLQDGKRFCLSCLSQIWRDYLVDRDSLQRELEKPKLAVTRDIRPSKI